jgi:hypothetical protein
VTRITKFSRHLELFTDRISERKSTLGEKLNNCPKDIIPKPEVGAELFEQEQAQIGDYRRWQNG